LFGILIVETVQNLFKCSFTTAEKCKLYKKVLFILRTMANGIGRNAKNAQKTRKKRAKNAQKTRKKRAKNARKVADNILAHDCGSLKVSTESLSKQ
jgi:hypothetical protein